MENSQLYNTGSIKFIKIFYRIFLAFLLVFLLLILFLKVNDTVTFTGGDIYSDNPKININAPNEVKILSIKISEGDHVKEGDTLLVLENKRVISDYNVSNLEIETMENKILILETLIQKAKDKKNSFTDLSGIQSNIYNTDIKSTQQEIENLKEKIELSQQQANIISDRFKTDSILYSKGAISRLELEEQKNNALDSKKNISEVINNYKKKLSEFENISNRYSENRNSNYRNIIEIENQITQYEKEILDLESAIENNKFNLEHLSEELNRLNIISPITGTVSNLFNTKQKTNIVLKGSLLVTVSPEKENFYAKIILPEKDLIYIKNGQNVNLKVDAYNYYKYGAIKGKISYVSPTNIEDNFYCLVHIHDYNKKIKLKSGYKFKGEVILEEMQLYQYIFKLLFNKIDESVNQ